MQLILKTIMLLFTSRKSLHTCKVHRGFTILRDIARWFAVALLCYIFNGEALLFLVLVSEYDSLLIGQFGPVRVI